MKQTCSLPEVSSQAGQPQMNTETSLQDLTMENKAMETTSSFVYFRLTLRWHTAWKTMRGGSAMPEPSLPTQDARPPSELPATPTTSTSLWSVKPNDVEQSMG